MNKVLINQEFHEDLVELITDTASREDRSRDYEIERLIDEKIDEADLNNNIKDEIENVKSQLEDYIDSKVNEAIENKMEDIESNLEIITRREIPKLLDRALADRKIDREELKEAVLELKDEWNKLIAQQVKYHFKILANFMIDQSQG